MVLRSHGCIDQMHFAYHHHHHQQSPFSLFIYYIYLPSFLVLDTRAHESGILRLRATRSRSVPSKLSFRHNRKTEEQTKTEHLSVISRALVLSFARSHGQYVVPRCDQSRASHPSGWYRSIFPLIPSLRSDTFKVYRSYQATRSSHDLALRTGNFNRPIT